MPLYIRLPNGDVYEVSQQEAKVIIRDLRSQIVAEDELDPNNLFRVDWDFVYNALSDPTIDPQTTEHRVGRLMGTMTAMERLAGDTASHFTWECSVCSTVFAPGARWCSHRHQGVTHVVFTPRDIANHAEEFLQGSQAGVGQQTLKDFKQLLYQVELVLQY